jgi:protein-arginine kinase activator protein McsA
MFGAPSFSTLSHEAYAPCHTPDEGEGGDGAAKRAALQERINSLHHQLESALGEEDFELCDTLNAEISALTRQRDALFGIQ